MSRKILAIDDHPDTVRLIEMTLRRHGYTVLGAFSGKEGINVAEAEQPDLILLDMMMPGMDGLTVCRYIRNHPVLRDTPIIMFSAKGQVAEKKESFEAGADDYLTKPTRPAELVERVNALVGRRSRDAETDDGEASRRASRLITVVGARGGVGATTVAINLATVLADQGQKTTLVDFDTQQGHVALYLGQRQHRDLNEWLALPASRLKDALSYYVQDARNGLKLLLSCAHLDTSQAALDRSHMEAIVAVLRDTDQTVVVDMGRGLGDAVHPLLEASDSILVCLRPEQPAIVAAKALVQYLEEIPVRSDATQVIMLDFSRGDNLPRTSVERFLGSPLLEVLQLDDRQVTRAVNRGQPLVHLEAARNTARQFERIASRLLLLEEASS